jgi:hypothetical protein
MNGESAICLQVTKQKISEGVRLAPQQRSYCIGQGGIHFYMVLFWEESKGTEEVIIFIGPTYTVLKPFRPPSNIPPSLYIITWGFCPEVDFSPCSRLVYQ